VHNLNKANALEVREKSLKLEKQKFDSQVLTDKAKNTDQLLRKAEEH